MECAGCRQETKNKLKGTRISFCSSCARYIDQWMLNRGRGIRNQFISVAPSVKRDLCLLCQKPFVLPGHKFDVLCTSDLLNYLYSLGVTLDNNPLLYDWLKPAIEWNKAWETRVNYSERIGRQDAYRFWIRGPKGYQYTVRFDKLLNRDYEEQSESENKSNDPLDNL